jgi:hypothetical protein
MMLLAFSERGNMARPKKTFTTNSIRMDVKAHQLAKQACSYTRESLVDYISRVVREQADKDAREGAEKFLRETKSSKRPRPSSTTE